MIQPFRVRNSVDEHGLPAGGTIEAQGIWIAWQDGPLGRDGDRQEPNGAFVETVIAAAKARIEFYQTTSGGRFACQENAIAIADLAHALLTLNERTARRESAGTEGTHAPDEVAAPTNGV